MWVEVEATQVKWPGALGTADTETIRASFSLLKFVAPKARNADLITAYGATDSPSTSRTQSAPTGSTTHSANCRSNKRTGIAHSGQRNRGKNSLRRSSDLIGTGSRFRSVTLPSDVTFCVARNSEISAVPGRRLIT